MSRFDEFVNGVLEGAKQLARDMLQKGIEEARQDAESFLQRTDEKMRRWTGLLARGELKRDEFEFLVRSQTDLAELAALNRMGIEAARLQAFRNKLIDLVINKAFDLIL